MKFKFKKDKTFFKHGKEYKVLHCQQIDGNAIVCIEGEPQPPRGARHRGLFSISSFFNEFEIPKGMTIKTFIQRFEVK